MAAETKETDIEAWTLSFVNGAPKWDVPLEVRVRKLLKYALRAVGLRCVDARGAAPADFLGWQPAQEGGGTVRLKCWLTRKANGLYLLTHEPPAIACIGNTERKDAFAKPGDPIVFDGIPGWMAKHVWGVSELEPLSSAAVWLAGGEGGGER